VSSCRVIPGKREGHPLLEDTNAGDIASLARQLRLHLTEGELLGLKWTDVDLEVDKLSVRRSLKVTDYRLTCGLIRTRPAAGAYLLTGAP
jgi:hypothetical protein